MIDVSELKELADRYDELRLDGFILTSKQEDDIQTAIETLREMIDEVDMERKNVEFKDMLLELQQDVQNFINNYNKDLSVDDVTFNIEHMAKISALLEELYI